MASRCNLEWCWISNLDRNTLSVQRAMTALLCYQCQLPLIKPTNITTSILTALLSLFFKLMASILQFICIYAPKNNEICSICVLRNAPCLPELSVVWISIGMLVNSAHAGSIVCSMGVGCPSWSPQISTSIPHLEGDQASFVLADWFFKFCLASSIAMCV